MISTLSVEVYAELVRLGFVCGFERVHWVSGLVLDEELGLPPGAQLTFNRGTGKLCIQAYSTIEQVVVGVESPEQLRTVVKLTDWPALVEEMRRELE